MKALIHPRGRYGRTLLEASYDPDAAYRPAFSDAEWAAIKAACSE